MDPLTPTDEQLAAAAARGDEEAFATLVKRWRVPIHDYLARVTRSREDAADLTQETFVKVWRKLPQRRGGGSFKSWLYAIAHNAALDVLRRRRPSEPFDEAWTTELAEPAGGDPASAVVARETAADVWKAAAALSPIEYTVLHCQLRLDMQAPEIAIATGMRAGAVHTALSRARDSFAEAFTILQLARHGRKDCPGLRAALGEQGPVALTREARRTARAHLTACEQCRASSIKLVSPAEVFAGLAPVLPREWFPPLPGTPRRHHRRPKRRRVREALAASAALVVIGFAVIEGASQSQAARDRTPPADPVEVRSPTDAPGAPASGASVVVTWPTAQDPTPRGERSSGVAGYSVAWSNEPVTMPDQIIDLGPGARSATGRVSPDRPTWFHLRTADRAGNWTSTVHWGPVFPAAWPTQVAPGGPPAASTSTSSTTSATATDGTTRATAPIPATTAPNIPTATTTAEPPGVGPSTTESPVTTTTAPPSTATTTTPPTTTTSTTTTSTTATTSTTQPLTTPPTQPPHPPPT